MFSRNGQEKKAGVGREGCFRPTGSTGGRGHIKNRRDFVFRPEVTGEPRRKAQFTPREGGARSGSVETIWGVIGTERIINSPAVTVLGPDHRNVEGMKKGAPERYGKQNGSQ